MPERHAIQITAGQDSVFASVLGGNAQDDPEAIHGLALFYSRPDLERRVLPLGEIPPCVTYPALRRCGACMKGKTRESNPLKKCTRCQVVYYCDADCQRRHWKVHKLDCLAVKDQQREDGDGVVWARREVSMLLGNITTMTFDDLDAVDAHQLMLSGTHDTVCLYIFTYSNMDIFMYSSCIQTFMYSNIHVRIHIHLSISRPTSFQAL